MKIFITGIAGFLGSHLAEEFLLDGHEVYGVDDLTGGYMENIPAGADFRVPVDTANVELMKECLNDFRPDVVYHLACCAYEGLSVFSPAFIVQNTLQNTMGILSASIVPSGGRSTRKNDFSSCNNGGCTSRDGGGASSTDAVLKEWQRRFNDAFQ